MIYWADLNYLTGISIESEVRSFSAVIIIRPRVCNLHVATFKAAVSISVVIGVTGLIC